MKKRKTPLQTPILTTLWAACLATCLQPSIAFDQPTENPPAIKVAFESRIQPDPVTGRILLLFNQIGKDGRAQNPISAPFWTDPQPIFSKAVTNLRPGQSIVFDNSIAGFPKTLADLKGEFKIVAVLDVDRTTAGFRLSQDNLHSDPQTITLPRKTKDGDEVGATFEIHLTKRFQPPTATSTDTVKLVEFKSPTLSAFHNRPFYLRSGVVLPPSYEKESDRLFPAVYHIPGFGGSHRSAWRRKGQPDRLDKNVIHIHLDADGPFGHHLYVNSENNGPVGDALVNELIPYLEKQFRLIPEPEARFLTGHSSGGFSTANLQINYPEFFGGCWATSPDPVNFHAFQSFDIYKAHSVYADATAVERPSVTIDGKIVCTVRQEMRMEDAIHPRNGSGEQWDSWIACFSPRDDDGYPRDLWNPRTGAIDPNVAAFWRKRDPGEIVRKNWSTIGQLLSKRLRIIVGDEDNFDLDEAVVLLRDELKTRPGWPSEPETISERAANGYIQILPGRTHFDLFRDGLGKRLRNEMYLSLESAGMLDRHVKP